jgi:hypothetical protein
MLKEYYNKETKTLNIPDSFNEELKDIPEETEIIVFSENYTDFSKFNQPVDNLPISLTHLTFGMYFNQPVDNLPKNLTYLKFGHSFNQPVDNLPENLTYLEFWYDFNQPVDNLPKKITHLIFGGSFNQPVNNLPDSIHILELYCYNNNNFIIPKNVKELYIYNYNSLINNLPEYIEKITIFFDEVEEEHVKRIKKINNLPLLLKEIIITHKIYKEFINIPFGTILTINE